MARNNQSFPGRLCRKVPHVNGRRVSCHVRLDPMKDVNINLYMP